MSRSNTIREGAELRRVLDVDVTELLLPKTPTPRLKADAFKRNVVKNARAAL